MKIHLTSILCLCLVYLIFAAPHLSEPLTYDELYWPYAAQTLNEGGRALNLSGGGASWSPALYVNLLSVVYRICGVTNISTRLLGVMAFVVTLAMLIFLAKDVLRGKYSLLLAGALFVTSPFTVQGSLLPCDDTVLLPVFLTGFLICFLKWYGQWNWKRAGILSLLFAVALWCKLTTPWVLIVLMMMCLWLRGNVRSDIWWLTWIAGLGLFLFLLTWKTYCWFMNVEFLGPFRYAFSAATSKNVLTGARDGVIGLGTDIIRFLLWLGPFVILLLAMEVWREAFAYVRSGELTDAAVLTLYVVMVGFVYFIVGGTTFGFPKYHFPMAPIIGIICARGIDTLWRRFKREDLLILAAIAALVAAYFAFFVGDLLFMFNFSLRQAIVCSRVETKRVIHQLMIGGALSMLPLIVTVPLIKKLQGRLRWGESLKVALIAIGLAGGLAQNTLQFKADYATRFCYGEKGTLELISYLKAETQDSSQIVAPNDILYYVRNKKGPFLPLGIWSDRQKLLSTVEKNKAKFLVYSIGHSTIAQFKEVFRDADFLERMKAEFTVRQIGSYIVWERRRSGLPG